MATPQHAPPIIEQGDTDLMRAVAGGNMSALGALVRRYQDHIRSVACRITGQWDVADDITQETFLRLYRAAPRYEPTAALSTWLYRVCVNLCLDRRRRKGRWLSLESDAELTAPADDDLLRRERVEAIRREVMALPDRQRVALVLHRFEGLTHQQVAEVTGWSRSSVESLLVRGYATLRDRLQSWVQSGDDHR